MPRRVRKLTNRSKEKKGDGESIEISLGAPPFNPAGHPPNFYDGRAMTYSRPIKLQLPIVSFYDHGRT